MEISTASPTDGDVTDVEVGTCCSWDLKSCGKDQAQKPKDWCDRSKGNCERLSDNSQGGCHGYWIDPNHSNRATCTARFIYCTTNEQCCDHDDGASSPLICLNYELGPACGFPGDGVDVSTPAPVPVVATNAPTKSPTRAPVIVTDAPTGAFDTSRPTIAIDNGPTPITGPFPEGPYVTAAAASATVVIPDPPVPATFPGEDCPHLEAGLLDWHDVATWSGITAPSEGADITLPSNARVLISKSVASKMGKVTIPLGAELVIGEDPSSANAEITIHAQGFDVKGKLTAGSESCRIRKPITVTLHGARPSNVVQSPREPEYKGISVSGADAELSLHGTRFYRTWTRLAKTVEVGDNVLMLQHDVNWAPGHQVILVTTALKDSREWHENEVLTVASVVANPVPGSGVGAAVFITSAVQHRHVAIANAYQAEVGLLSRTIKIQGSADDSYATDPDDGTCTYNGSRSFLGSDQQRPCPNTELTGYGGHIMVHNDGRGYVEGVELYRMGQTNVLGRYVSRLFVLFICFVFFLLLMDDSCMRILLILLLV
jgi:hypothetical protein